MGSSMLEQAVFTSSRTDRMDGYQLVACSEGVTPQQQEELSAWGPAHDSLCWPTSRIGSFNFHRLNCGTFCVSKSAPAGAEYSGRSGPRVYTTMLLLTLPQLQRFSNQPFRVLDAAIASGQLRIVRRFSDTLPGVRLRGRASPALPTLLEPLTDPEKRSGVLALAIAVSRGAVLFVPADDARSAIDQLFNILPIECRLEVSYSTGLKLSSQRPFVLQAAPEDAMEAKSAAHNAEATLVDFSTATPDVLNGWWAMVDELLERGQVADLVSILGQPRPDITLDSLCNWSEAVTQ